MWTWGFVRLISPRTRPVNQPVTPPPRAQRPPTADKHTFLLISSIHQRCYSLSLSLSLSLSPSLSLSVISATLFLQQHPPSLSLCWVQYWAVNEVGGVLAALQASLQEQSAFVPCAVDYPVGRFLTSKGRPRGVITGREVFTFAPGW